MSLFDRSGRASLRSIMTLFLVINFFSVLHPFKTCGSLAEDIGIVTATYLNLRSEPGLNNPPLKTLKNGDKVKIIEYLDGWIKVLHGQQVGYIRYKKNYIRIIGSGYSLQKNSDAPETKIDRIKKEAEEITRQIEKSEQEIVTYTEKEAAVISGLNEMEMALNRSIKRFGALKAELDTVEKKISENNLASENLVKRIQVNEAYAAKRLVALYKLNTLGRIHVLASSESIYDFFLRRSSLKKVLTYDEKLLKNLTESKAELEKIHNRLTVQKTEKHSLEEDIQKQIDILSLERVKRSEVLVEIRKKKSLELAAIDSLKQAAKTLDQTIRSLSEKYSHPASPADTSAEKRRTDETSEVSGKKFVDLKGLLNMPVKGTIIASFGAHKTKKFNLVNFRSGIDIQADRGEPIRAVSSGHVLYAAWFKGYGNMMIIDHGDSYYTLYAHAEELFKKEGDFIETGEVIATVGDSGSMIGPVLYFEVRFHGKPVDPLEWINTG